MNASRIMVGLLAAAAFGSVLVGCGKDEEGQEPGTEALSAVLSGAEEVPGPGDPDGSGTADIRIDTESGEVCFDLRWLEIEQPNRAHIHEGPAGVAGPVVVPFFESSMAGDMATGCVENVSRSVRDAILARPGDYYVNIHNPEYPDGAIRGQLQRAAGSP